MHSHLCSSLSPRALETTSQLVASLLASSSQAARTPLGSNKKPKNSTSLNFDDSDLSSDEDEENGPPPPQAKAAEPSKHSSTVRNINVNQPPQKRQRKRMWSKEEEEAVAAGVKRHGVGNWSKILKDYEAVLVGRSSVNVKDKWRNMNK